MAPSEDAYVEFLGVRKIPVRRRGRIREDGSFGDVAPIEEGMGREVEVGESAMDVDGADKVEGAEGEAVEGAKKVVKEEEEDPDAEAVSKFESTIRAHLLTDRDLSDRGARAFVSFVRAYGTHDAGFLFRSSALDLVGLARAYGLLRLPRMPELKGRSTSSWTDAEVDWEEYAYKDEKQEVKRRVEGKKRKEEGEERKDRKRRKVMEVAWSEQVARKDGKEKRKQKKIAKRIWLNTQKNAGAEGAEEGANGSEDGVSEAEGGEKEIGSREESGGLEEAEDWKELEREERAAKKARRGGAAQVALEADFGDL